MIAVLVAMVIWVFVDVRRRGRTNPERPEVHRTDLTAYTSAAEVWWNGGTSEEAYAAASPRNWRYQYPPFFGTVMGPLSSFETKTQSLLFGLFSIVLVFGVYFETKRLIHLFASSHLGPGDGLRRGGLDPPEWIGICAGIAFALPMLNTIQRGQVGLLVIYPLMLGFRLTWTCRPSLGGIALAFPAVLKILPTLSSGTVLLSTTLPLLRRDARRTPGIAGRAVRNCLGFAIGIVLFLLVIPALIIGWQNNLDGICYFVDNVVINTDFSKDWGFDIHSMRNQSLAGASWQLLDTIHGGLGTTHDADVTNGHPAEVGTAATIIRLARWAMLGLFLLTVLRLSTARRTWGDPRAAAVVFGLSCAATLVFSPVAWGHHYVQGIAAWVAIPAWLYLRGLGATAYWMAVVPAVLVLAHYLVMPIAAPLGVLGLGTTAWLAVACVLCWKTS